MRPQTERQSRFEGNRGGGANARSSAACRSVELARLASIVSPHSKTRHEISATSPRTIARRSYHDGGLIVLVPRQPGALDPRRRRLSLPEAGHERAHVVHLSRRAGAFKDIERDRRMHPSFLRLAPGV
jgi:hypothetical protein